MITLQIMSHDYQQWRWTDNDIPEGDWWRHGHIFDDACTRQLQSLSFCSCQTYTVSLCQPNGWQWDHAVFCLAFLLGFLHSVAQTFFFFGAGLLSHMKTGSQPQSLSHQLCSFIMWIFSSILPFVLLNDKFSKYVQGLNSNVWVLERCLLQMLLIK